MWMNARTLACAETESASINQEPIDATVNQDGPERSVIWMSMSASAIHAKTMPLA